MGFSKMIELLQMKNKGYIVLVKTGNFYIARGKDALALNKMLDLKLTCLETEICKVGFPISSLEKYTKLIEDKKYSYIVYNYNGELGKLEVIKKYDGKKRNKITENSQNCYYCTKGVGRYKEDRYIQAVAHLLEEEIAKEEKEE